MFWNYLNNVIFIHLFVLLLFFFLNFPFISHFSSTHLCTCHPHSFSSLELKEEEGEEIQGRCGEEGKEEMWKRVERKRVSVWEVALQEKA